nr:hypothetical protein [Candidatus Njordarchaeum guaymaensis]
MVTIVHDFDFPISKRSTCLKRAFWLIISGLLGNRKWLIKRMPVWFAREKYAFALALAKIDKLHGVNAVFGLTEEVRQVFPELQQLLKGMGFEVRHHYHIAKKTLGKGAWDPPLEMKPENMIYDRLYSLANREQMPKSGEAVVWHVDHPYNLSKYLEFLERAKREKLI